MHSLFNHFKIVYIIFNKGMTKINRYGVQDLRQCKYCKKYFKPKFGNHKFCSAECSNNYIRDDFIKILIREKKNKTHHKTENVATIKQNEDINTNLVQTSKDEYTLNCKHCGKVFITKNKLGKYCSIICREQDRANMRLEKSKAQTNNFNRDELYVIEQVKYLINMALISTAVSSFSSYGFTESLKDKIRERDDYTCQVCGSGLNLHVHHIIPRKWGGTNETENLITLCASCHNAIETKDIEYATTKCLKNLKKDDLTHKYTNYEVIYKQKIKDLEVLFNMILQSFHEEEVAYEILQIINNIIDEG